MAGRPPTSRVDGISRGGRARRRSKGIPKSLAFCPENLLVFPLLFGLALKVMVALKVWLTVSLRWMLTSPETTRRDPGDNPDQLVDLRVAKRVWASHHLPVFSRLLDLGDDGSDRTALQEQFRRDVNGRLRIDQRHKVLVERARPGKRSPRLRNRVIPLHKQSRVLPIFDPEVNEPARFAVGEARLKLNVSQDVLSVRHERLLEILERR